MQLPAGACRKHIKRRHASEHDVRRHRVSKIINMEISDRSQLMHRSECIDPNALNEEPARVYEQWSTQINT